MEGNGPDRGQLSCDDDNDDETELDVTGRFDVLSYGSEAGVVTHSAPLT